MPRDRPSPRQVARIASQTAHLRERLGDVTAPRLADIGGEHGWTGQSLRLAYPAARLETVDAWAPYCDLLRERGWYDAVWGGPAHVWLEANGAWDAIVAAEIIEHMSVEDGDTLLELLSTHTEVPVVTTPTSWMPQGEIEGNPHQRHVSYWTPQMFAERGWQTVELNERCNYGVYTRGL